MNGNWYLVASRNSAKFFTEVPRAHKLKLVAQLENPLAKVRNRDLSRRRPSREAKSLGRAGSIRFGAGTRTSAKDDAAEQFAREVASFVEAHRQIKNLNSLTVAAEPFFMGKFRAALRSAKTLVTEWIPKDLEKIPPSKLSHIFLMDGET
jgi:protein required for attachment to host cells